MIRGKRGLQKRIKGYFKGNKPEWLCETPEPYIISKEENFFGKTA